MQDKLSMTNYFSNMEIKGGLVLLLTETHTTSLQTETNTSVYDVLDEAISLYYTYHQLKGESNTKCLGKLKSIVVAIEHL